MHSGSQRLQGITILFLAGMAIHLTLIGEKNIEQPSHEKTRPNILFLSVDDMKDWVGCLDGYGGIVHTPHIDQLAKQGMLFTNAHCPSPKCAPSRAAIMTGKMPSTSGLYDNGHWWFPNYPETTTLPIHFKQSGYTVAGAGKVYHHTAGKTTPDFRRNLPRRGRVGTFLMRQEGVKPFTPSPGAVRPVNTESNNLSMRSNTPNECLISYGETCPMKPCANLPWTEHF